MTYPHVKIALLPLLIGASLSLRAQTVSLADFENGGAFSLEGLESYCDTNWLFGSTDTPGPGSQWSLMLPAAFLTCPAPGWSGVFFRMDGLMPGDEVNIRFWMKAQTGAIDFLVWYFEPVLGVLPADPASSVGNYFFFSGGGPAVVDWQQVWSPFTLPPGTPWPADLYLQLYFDPDVPTDEYALIDDVELELVLPTGTAVDPARPALRLSPVPASDGLRIEGAPANLPLELFNARGQSLTAAFNAATGNLDIAHLQAGLYMIRCGHRSGRFVKE